MPMPPDLSANTDDKLGFKLKGMQLPLVSNAAATGHKWQGSTVKHLFIHDWNYTTNWPYVFLSRVTKMEGLFFRDKLQKKFTTFKLPDKYRSVMEQFCTKAAQMLTDQLDRR